MNDQSIDVKKLIKLWEFATGANLREYRQKLAKQELDDLVFLIDVIINIVEREDTNRAR
jgi:hypothetical protein